MLRGTEYKNSLASVLEFDCNVDILSFNDRARLLCTGPRGVVHFHFSHLDCCIYKMCGIMTELRQA